MMQGLMPWAGLTPPVLEAPSGTRMPFQQVSAPLGWTADTSASLSDCSSTIRQAAGGTTGGSILWSSWNFGGTFNFNALTLSLAQMPSHSHPTSDPGHHHPGNGGQIVSSGGGGFTTVAQNGSFHLTPLTDGDPSGITINNNGSGSPITPSFVTPQVKYTDHIIGVKA